jgi:hypothetical protein
MILMKFKEYTIQLAISVKTDEMENKGFPEEFFLRNRYGQTPYFFKSRSSWAGLEQDFIRIIACDDNLKAK